MAEVSLPPLPEPAGWKWEMHPEAGGGISETGEWTVLLHPEHPHKYQPARLVRNIEAVHTASQLQAYAREAVMAERERCARIAASRESWEQSEYGRGADDVAIEIAEAIRSPKE